MICNQGLWLRRNGLSGKGRRKWILGENNGNGILGFLKLQGECGQKF